MFRLTSEHHPAKNSVVPVQRAAVPAVVSELMLALFDPLFGSLADGLHQVWVPLAELPLLVHKTGNVVAYHPRTQSSDVPAHRSIEHSVGKFKDNSTESALYGSAPAAVTRLCARISFSSEFTFKFAFLFSSRQKQKKLCS